MNHFILALKVVLLIILNAIAIPTGIIIYAVLLLVAPFLGFNDMMKKNIAESLDDSNFSKKVESILEWI